MSNPPSQRASATIEDVAKLAGVSIKTVSRVVNSEPNVRVSTKAAVQAAIAELNYQPNRSARSLAGRRSYLISLLYDTFLAQSAYIMRVQLGLLEECRKAGYELLIHPVNYESENLKETITRHISQSHIDGAIMTPPIADLLTVTNCFQQHNKPYVCLTPGRELRSGLSVETDNRFAAQKVTQHLLALGHTRFGFVRGHPDHLAMVQREQGFEDALREAAPALAQSAMRVQGYNTFQSGMEAAATLLALPEPPTAIIASNDEMAAGVIRYANERGLRIPEQLSVTGFDDSPIAEQIWPPLTTVRQPVQSMSVLAAKLLIAELSGKREGKGTTVEASELVIRGSTTKAPQQVSQK
ncbi:LacI family DNA-binding transcriptional regulator [Halioxenophilus sp. WMMB6]|uniref:LacI family DNA-binding transcriptional regulator n=1 Tax=Halioxenophilus sp. WMMB6 TaxID=3073815 RepID=UPI00295EF2C6|nr:LacI family DNA-binding transcriptional regulator [Halioxenophilus sp. WMMB6]